MYGQDHPDMANLRLFGPLPLYQEPWQYLLLRTGSRLV